MPDLGISQDELNEMRTAAGPDPAEMQQMKDAVQEHLPPEKKLPPDLYAASSKEDSVQNPVTGWVKREPWKGITKLTPEEQPKFDKWAKENNVPNENGVFGHYDMPRYWRDIVSKGKSATSINPDDKEAHYPDTYKGPGHPSFSRQSMYAKADDPFWPNEHQLMDKNGKILWDERTKGAPDAVSADELSQMKEAAGTAPQKGPLQGFVDYTRQMRREAHQPGKAAVGALAGGGKGIGNVVDIVGNLGKGIMEHAGPSPEMWQAMVKNNPMLQYDAVTKAYEDIPAIKKAQAASPAMYGTGGAVSPFLVPIPGIQAERMGAGALGAASKVPIAGVVPAIANALIRSTPAPVARTLYSAIGNLPLSATLAYNDLNREGKQPTLSNLVQAGLPYLAFGTGLHALGEAGGAVAERLQQARAAKAVPVPEANVQETAGAEPPPPTVAQGPAAQKLKVSTAELQKKPQVDYGDREAKLKDIWKNVPEAPPLESLGKQKATKVKSILSTLASKKKAINDQEEIVKAYANELIGFAQKWGGMPEAALKQDVTLKEDIQEAIKAGVRGLKHEYTQDSFEVNPHEGGEPISPALQAQINRMKVARNAPELLAKEFAREHTRLRDLENEFDSYKEGSVNVGTKAHPEQRPIKDLLNEAIPFETHVIHNETTFQHLPSKLRVVGGTKRAEAAKAIYEQRIGEAKEVPENVAFTHPSQYQKMHLQKVYNQIPDLLKGKVDPAEIAVWKGAAEALQRNKPTAALSVIDPATPAIMKAAQVFKTAAKSWTPEDGQIAAGTFHSQDIYRKYDPQLAQAMMEKVGELNQISGGVKLAKTPEEMKLFAQSKSMKYYDVLKGKKGLDKLDDQQREYLVRRNAVLEETEDLLRKRFETLYPDRTKPFSIFNLYGDKALGLAIQKDLDQLAGKSQSAPGVGGIFESIVNGRMQVGQQHLLEALLINGAYDRKLTANLMQSVKADPRIWEFTKLYQGSGPLRDVYNAAMESENPLQKLWAQTDKNINEKWMNQIGSMMKPEHRETLKGLINNSIPETFKGQITRAVALSKAAEDMKVPAGDLAQLLMDDAAGKIGVDSAKALELHTRIAQDMYEKLGWGAPGYRHLGVFQYMPFASYAAPFKVQANNQAAAMNRLWMGAIRHYMDGDHEAGGTELKKLFTYVGLNSLLLGPKALPKELLAVGAFAAPGFMQEFNHLMNRAAIVGHLFNTEPTHLQPSIAPLIHSDASFIHDALKIADRVTGSITGSGHKENSKEDTESQIKHAIQGTLFVMSLAHMSSFLNGTMGTMQLYNIGNHIYEGIKRKRNVWAFSPAPLAQFLARKTAKTNILSNAYHAFVPGERPEDEEFIADNVNNYMARLHVKFMYPDKYDQMNKQAQKYEQTQIPKGLPKQVQAAVRARLKATQERTPIRSFNWIDAANKLDEGRLHGIVRFFTGKSVPQG